MRVEVLAVGLERPLLVTTPTNVTYLTGFRSSNAALLVEPGGEATLYADFRYAEAGRGVQGVTFVEVGRDLFGHLGRILAGRGIDFEAAHLSVAQHATLAASVELGSTTGLVEALREVKDAGEIDLIRGAAGLSDQVFGELAGERFVGRTERELAWWVERRFRELGAERVAFDVAVAAGSNGALPHARPSETQIARGTLVTVDAGCVVDGYCSDCTRTFATGALPDELAHAYDLCLRGQIDALHAVRPGVVGSDVDAVSRRAIEGAGLGERYGHGVGHGVGLDVHESPALRPGGETRLRAGNVITIEPGIYLPGVGGVRIEDLVLVTEEGHERLTLFAKDLITVS